MKRSTLIICCTIVISAILIPAYIITCHRQKSDNIIQKGKTTITWIEDKPGPSFQEHRVFPSVPDSLWEALGLPKGIPSSMSCFLLSTEDRTILIDAGIGAPFSTLVTKLSESGIKPDELECIYITHMHPDHIGGMLDEGKAVFPNARVYINKKEVEAWQDSDDKQSAMQKSVLEVYRGNIHMFEAGDTLEGGVVTVPAYGHTAGHTIFQKDSILVIGDLLHGAALQLKHPEYCAFYDKDPGKAIESRIRILEYARMNNLTMFGMHLPDPGFIK